MRAAKAAKDLHEVCSSLSEQLREYLSSRVSAESCEVHYLSDQVLPLLLDIAGALCIESPKDPRSFLLHWTAERLGLPSELLSQLRETAPPKELAVRPPDGRPSSGRPRRTAKVASSSDDNADVAAEASSKTTDALEEGSTTCTPQDGEQRDGERTTCRSEDGEQPGDGDEAPPSAMKDGEQRDVERTTSSSEDGEQPGDGDEASPSAMKGEPTNATEVGEEPTELAQLPVPLPATRADSKSYVSPAGSKQGSRRPSLQYLLGWSARQGGHSQDFALTMPSTETVLKALRTVPMLQKLPEQDLLKVAEVTSVHRYEEDQTLVHVGEVEESLHMILDGHCRVFIPQLIGQISKGDFLGEDGLRMYGATSGTQVVALNGGVTTLSVRRADFEALDVLKGIGKRQRKVACHWSVEESFLRQVTPHQNFMYCKATGHALDDQYTMTEHDKTMILNSVRNNKVLGDVMSLTEEQCQMFLRSVYLVIVPAGTSVFKRGHKGTAFFIVQEGYLESQQEAWNEERRNSIQQGACTRQADQATHVQFRYGDTFGELALMYDEPRQATVTAHMDSKLWVMPQLAFRSVIQISAKAKLAEFEQLLRTVPTFTSKVDNSLFSMLASIVEEAAFTKSQVVCTEGEDVGSFFLVLEGRCRVQVSEGEGTVYEKGSWFGEEALMNATTATETVVVESDSAVVLVLDEDSYQVVLAAQREVEHKALSKSEVWRKQVHKVISSLKGLRLFGNLRKMKTQQHVVRLDRCEPVGALGEGSFGLVLLIRDKDSKQEFALKAMNKEHMRMEDQEKMMQNERKLLELIESKFVVRLYKSYEDSNFVFFMLDAVFGGELFDVYTEKGMWGNTDYARFYLANVVLGLTHLHSKRIVWRDLKLENCLVDSAGYLKLADMGIAKLVIGKTYTVCGTADYFAPETLKQLGHNRAADWWALGVLLFIMINGRSPFDAPEVSQIYRNIIKGMGKVEFPRSCPREARELILALCRKKPEDRLPMQKGGLKSLQSMPFFKGLDWDEVDARVCPAPWIPDAPDYDRIKDRKLSRPVDINWEEVRELANEEDPIASLLSSPTDAPDPEEEPPEDPQD